MIDTMDAHERDAAEDQLRVYEVLDAALARRNEILELVSSSADPDEAEERIRDLLDLQVPGLSRVVLDLQVFRLTASEREKLSERTRELRRLVRHRTTH
jgi:DNA gyrase/topoisomerase IV subunit A